MTWFLSTAANIGKSLGQATKSSLEFALDIGQEVIGTNDNYDGVWGTVWGSWEDNVLGATGEEGVVQHLFGEQGAGGHFFGAIPEQIRNPVNSVITPTFEAMEWAYEEIVDRPLGTLIQVTHRGVMNTFDAFTGQGELGDVVSLFNPNEWRQAYQITESRSSGQALALASRWIDLDDPDEVERFKGTAYYQLTSGAVDMLANIILDPANVLFGTGKVGKLSKLGRTHVKKAVGIGYQTAEEAIKHSQKYARFDQAIENLRYSDDLTWSDNYKSGTGFTDDDIANIDILTGKILKEAREGKLGKGQKGMSQDQARALASLPNKAARDAYLKLTVAGGDSTVMDEMTEAARAHNLSHQEGGLRYQLDEVKKQLDDTSSPEFADQDARDFLMREQKRLEKQLMEENPELPFGAALSMKEERLRALAVRKDVDRGYITADELNARWDVLNDDQHLVDAATDQVLLGNHIDTMDAVPAIGNFNSAGLAVRTFVDKTPLLGAVASTRVVRAIVEKVPQGIIVWDDVDQGFTQFQRMLRDAEKIGINKIDELFVDKKLGEWTSTKDQNRLREIFEETTEEINTGLIDHFGERVAGIDKERIHQLLQRQFKQADSELKAKGRSARVYGTKGIRITTASEGGETVARYMPITTAQLEASALVPRYDLYRQLFNDTSVFRTNINGAMAATANVLNAFTTVWKKSVLLRPAWPMRVLIDEYARTAAQIGTIDTLKSMMGGMGDLRARWFRKEGIDLGPLMQERMLDDLGYKTIDDARRGSIYGAEKGIEDLEKIIKEDLTKFDPKDWHPETTRRVEEALTRKDYYGDTDVTAIQSKIDDLRVKRDELIAENQPINYYDLVEEYIQKNGEKGATSLVQDILYKEYGRKKIRRRSLGVAAGAGLVAGPAGLAIGGLYGLLARNSLKRLAQMETASVVGLQLRSVARTQLREEITAIRRSVEGVTDPVQLKLKAEEITNLNVAADLLEAQAKNLSTQHAMQKNSLKLHNEELYDNFDRAGRMLHDAGLGNAHIGGIGYSNHFGNNAQEISIYRAAVSADNSNRALWDSASVAQRKTQRVGERITYELPSGPTEFVRGRATTRQAERFQDAYNDTVNRQFVPSTDPSVNNAFQDFQRMMWEDRSHIDIINWLQSREGAVLRDAMPHYFKKTDVVDYNDLLEAMRQEFNSLIPNHPDFAVVRKQVIEGREIHWGRDIQPIIDRKYGGDIQNVRNQLNDMDFGKVLGDDSLLQDAVNSGRFLTRVQNKIDSIFTHIGTMPTDTLTRSLVFKTSYTREMSRRLARYEDSGVFRLKQSDIKQMENQARTVALKETRNLLYDLAERSKFEEVVSNIMPFYGAWQEVITRWAGLAQRNPVFVAAGSRNFRKAINEVDAEDENGDPNFVLALPEGFMNIKIPGTDVRVFGRIAALGENAIDFNFGSASMISAGLPGFGPMISIPVSETALRIPELAESLELLLPYGPTEGQSFTERVMKQTMPTWVKTARSTAFNTAQRQRIKARITADVAAWYEENGETIESETDWMEFEKEIERRAQDILTVRMLGNLALPISFLAQSPHYSIINSYQKILAENGIEEADEWLLTSHPEMFVVLGRQTKVKTVASATLPGEKLYQQTKEFADDHQNIGDFIVGKVGALDSGFEYNRAVMTKEINEGRRVRMEPREIYTRAAGDRGWHVFRDQMQLVNQELARRGANGLSVNLNASVNRDLRQIKRKLVETIAIDNPLWKEKFDTFKSDDVRAEVIHSFRAVTESELFKDRVELHLIEEYISTRDLIAEELERRELGSGNPDAGLLSYKSNNDLKQLWLKFRIVQSSKDDFADIYFRYFENDESISRASWPTSWMVEEMAVDEEKLAI